MQEPGTASAPPAGSVAFPSTGAIGFAGPPRELSASAPWRRWSASLILHRLTEGVTVDQLASDLELAPDVMRAALRDLARRSQVSKRLAGILDRLADGDTITEAASRLQMTEEEVVTELSPTEALERGFAGTLMARAAMPVEPSGYLGAPAQGPLRTMPVRFPEPQYHRLKDWSEAHNFPMAVVVRGVVERFLDEQERRAG